MLSCIFTSALQIRRVCTPFGDEGCFMGEPKECLPHLVMTKNIPRLVVVVFYVVFHFSSCRFSSYWVSLVLTRTNFTTKTRVGGAFLSSAPSPCHSLTLDLFFDHLEWFVFRDSGLWSRAWSRFRALFVISNSFSASTVLISCSSGSSFSASRFFGTSEHEQYPAAYWLVRGLMLISSCNFTIESIIWAARQCCSLQTIHICWWRHIC